MPRCSRSRSRSPGPAALGADQRHAHVELRLRCRLGAAHPGGDRARHPGAAAADRLHLRRLRQQDAGDGQRRRHRHPLRQHRPTTRKASSPTSATNALSQSESWLYDTRFGAADQPYRPERAHHHLDLRQLRPQDAGGARRRHAHQLELSVLLSGVAGGTASCPAGGTYLVQATPLGVRRHDAESGRSTTVYFDQLGRDIAARHARASTAAPSAPPRNTTRRAGWRRRAGPTSCPAARRAGPPTPTIRSAVC